MNESLQEQRDSLLEATELVLNILNSNERDPFLRELESHTQNTKQEYKSHIDEYVNKKGEEIDGEIEKILQEIEGIYKKQNGNNGYNRENSEPSILYLLKTLSKLPDTENKLTEFKDLNNRLIKLYKTLFQDKLTSLSNRWGFLEKISKLFKKSSQDIQQNKEKGTFYKHNYLIIFDIDFFTAFNDFGHHFGDLVLKALSLKLLEFKKNQLAKDGNNINIDLRRWGGEEFLIFIQSSEEISADKVKDFKNNIQSYIQGIIGKLNPTDNKNLVQRSVNKHLIEKRKGEFNARFYQQISEKEGNLESAKKNAINTLNKNIDVIINIKKGADKNKKTKVIELLKERIKNIIDRSENFQELIENIHQSFSYVKRAIVLLVLKSKDIENIEGIKIEPIPSGPMVVAGLTASEFEQIANDIDPDYLIQETELKIEYYENIANKASSGKKIQYLSKAKLLRYALAKTKPIAKRIQKITGDTQEDEQKKKNLKKILLDTYTSTIIGERYYINKIKKQSIYNSEYNNCIENLKQIWKNIPEQIRKELQIKIDKFAYEDNSPAHMLQILYLLKDKLLEDKNNDNTINDINNLIAQLELPKEEIGTLTLVFSPIEDNILNIPISHLHKKRLANVFERSITKSDERSITINEILSDIISYTHIDKSYTLLDMKARCTQISKNAIKRDPRLKLKKEDKEGENVSKRKGLQNRKNIINYVEQKILPDIFNGRGIDDITLQDIKNFIQNPDNITYSDLYHLVSYFAILCDWSFKHNPKYQKYIQENAELENPLHQALGVLIQETNNIVQDVSRSILQICFQGIENLKNTGKRNIFIETQVDQEAMNTKIKTDERGGNNLQEYIDKLYLLTDRVRQVLFQRRKPPHDDFPILKPEIEKMKSIIKNLQNDIISAISYKKHIDDKKYINEVISKIESTISRLFSLKYLDHLTGAFNRDVFDKTVNLYLEQIKFAVISLDGDRLKLLNEGIDHFAGDMYLMLYSLFFNDTQNRAYREWKEEYDRVVREEIGNNGQAPYNEYPLFFRIGGEEFAIILPYISTKKAQELAVSLAEKVKTYIRDELAIEKNEEIKNRLIKAAERIYGVSGEEAEKIVSELGGFTAGIISTSDIDDIIWAYNEIAGYYNRININNIRITPKKLMEISDIIAEGLKTAGMRGRSANIVSLLMAYYEKDREKYKQFLKKIIEILKK